MKTIIQRIGLAALLCAIPAIKSEAITINSGLLSLVDGTSYINIGEIFGFANNILALLHGTNIKSLEAIKEAYGLNLPEPLKPYVDDKGKVGAIWFNNNYHTIKNIVIYEENNPNDSDLRHALMMTCNHFEKLSEEYVAEIETAKDIMVQIIENWSKLRNRPDSLLLHWSKVDVGDREGLYKTMTSFKLFDTFLEDLLLFLKDLIQNCPKSHKQYRETL